MTLEVSFWDLFLLILIYGMALLAAITCIILFIMLAVAVISYIGEYFTRRE